MTVLNELKRDISDIRFSRSAFGYRASEVDLFIDGLQKKILSAIDERDSLISENARLKDELSELKNTQESITRAIANSEKIAQASVIDAGVKSKYILKDASEKAAIMVKTANDEYKKTIDEVNKIGSDINSFVGDYIKKLESQIESMKAISKVPVSPLNLDDFQISDVAKKFIENDNVDGTLSVFSDVEVDNKEVKHKKKSKYNNLQFGARFKQF